MPSLFICITHKVSLSCHQEVWALFESDGVTITSKPSGKLLACLLVEYLLPALRLNLSFLASTSHNKVT